MSIGGFYDKRVSLTLPIPLEFNGKSKEGDWEFIMIE
jgi:hypothetical protein